LLVLGTALSTYLGLMVTRGLRWLEAGAGVLVMTALMILAIAIVEGKESSYFVYAAEGLLAALVFVLRAIARRRWSELDWLECRPERTLAARGTA
jgi:hypothetical protein